MTIRTAKTPVDIVYPDQVLNVEKAVISDDNQLVIYFEGSLSNSVRRSKFTFNIPLKDIGTRPKEIQSYALEFGTNQYAEGIIAVLNVPRDSIHAGWASHTNGNLESVAIKEAPIPLRSWAIGGPPGPFPSWAGGSSYQQRYYYDESAKLLPNKGKTLFYIKADGRGDGFLPPLEFLYVDGSREQKYTLIYADQVHAAANNAAVYCFIPVAVPLDIITAPFQLVCVLYVECMPM